MYSILYMEENEEITEPLTKPKKPRSQKQIEAFQETIRKRTENVELRKQEKLIKASQILVNNSKLKPVVKPIPPKQVHLSSSESSSEEEIIIVKAKPKKKKKIKKIIIESSESDSSSGSDGGGNGSRYKPQKVSIQREYQKPVFNSNNFFV